MMTMMMSAAARTTTFGREVHADPQRLAAGRQKKKNEKHDFLRQTAFSLLHWAQQQQQPPPGKSSSPSSAPPPPREKEKDIPKKMKQGVVDDADDDDVSSEEEKKATAAAAGTWWRTSVQHLLPTDLHDQESTHLLTLLYAIGIIPAYIRAAYAAHIDAVHDGIEAEDETNDARDTALFASYFNCTHLLTENNTTTETTVLSSTKVDRGDMQLDDSWTDNFGRIISLSLRGGPWNNNNTHRGGTRAASFRLPPIIQAFTNLERLHLTQCQHLPTELGTLPSLQSLVFQDCPQTMFRNLPPGMKLTLPALTKVCIRTRTSHHHRQRDCGGSGGHDDDEKEEEDDVVLDAAVLSSFMKIFPKTVEELSFEYTTPKQTKEILCVLAQQKQHSSQDDSERKGEDDTTSTTTTPVLLPFRQQLKVLKLEGCALTASELTQLVLEIRPLFPRLQTLSVEFNKHHPTARTFLGFIEKRLNQQLQQQQQQQQQRDHRHSSSPEKAFEVILIS